MPTRKAVTFTILAVVLYMLANQTQVGWVYIMADALIGLLLIAGFFSWGTLKPLHFHRTFINLSTKDSANGLSSDDLNLTDFFEDDALQINLHVTQTSLRPAFLVKGQQLCPFAPPDQQQQPFFIPSLFKNKFAQLSYQTTCHRRGLYNFVPITLRSKGPFSLFNTKCTVDVSSQILIYPQYHPLNRLRLVENRGFSDRQVMRIGTGTEIVGTREYRSGDSLRQIHWRSTARRGKLVVKEFLDNDQLTITVILDLSTDSTLGKDSPFETAVRLAASLGYYADKKSIPFRLIGQSPRWKAPDIALSWSGTLNYLAKVQNDGAQSLAKVLHNLPLQPFVVVLISQPNELINRELEILHRRGSQVLAIFIAANENLPSPPPLKSRPGLETRTVTSATWTTILDEL